MELVLSCCLVYAALDAAMAQTADDFNDAEARRIEVDADYLKKQCLPEAARLRQSVPQSNVLKPLLDALYSDEFCNCTMRNYQRNMPARAFRDKDEAELLAFTKRSAVACSLNILQESLDATCPSMMAGIARRSRTNVPRDFAPEACSCFDTVVKSMSAGDLAQLETRNLLDIDEAKKGREKRRDEPDSAMDQMQACLLKSGFLPPLRK